MTKPKDAPAGDGEAPARAKPRGLDPELQAMARIDRILSEMHADQQRRIILWLDDRYAEAETVPYADGGRQPGA